jgi:hypothetical protein
MRDLKQQIKDMRKSLSVDSVARALRDVKEYAVRTNEINTDTLHMKLMHLDEMGRKCDYADCYTQ